MSERQVLLVFIDRAICVCVSHSISNGIAALDILRDLSRVGVWVCRGVCVLFGDIRLACMCLSAACLFVPLHVCVAQNESNLDIKNGKGCTPVSMCLSHTLCIAFSSFSFCVSHMGVCVSLHVYVWIPQRVCVSSYWRLAGKETCLL